MSKTNLIDIREGETGIINGKPYKAELADLYGSKMCMTCDLFEPGSGCTNNQVICYCPPRIFKEIKEPIFSGCYDNYDDYNEFDGVKSWHLVILIILLSIPMACCWFWEKVFTFLLYIINKIRKYDTNE